MQDERTRALWPIWAMAITMAGGGVALFALASMQPAQPRVMHVPWYVLALGFTVVELCPLYFQLRGETHSFALHEIVLVIGLFTLSPLGLLAASVAGCIVVLGAVRRIPAVKLTFNLGQLVLSTAAATVVFGAIASGSGTLAFRNWVAAFAATATFAVIGALAVAVAITIVQRSLARAALRSSVLLAVAGALVNTMLGLVAVIVLSESLVAVGLLIGPIIVVFAAYRAYLSERAKTARLQFLYRASELLSDARDLEAGLLALLDFARDTFHVELAEVVLLGEPDEPMGFHTHSGPGDRGTRLEPVERDDVNSVLDAAGDATGTVLHRPEPESPLATRHGVEIASMMIAPLHGESGARGAVFVARPRGAIIESFTKDEQRLFETFSTQLATTMERSRLSTSLAALRVLKQELQHQAHYDSLTGLANRALFRERVDEALSEASADGTSVAVLFIDLDDFKTVNDTMGHAAGDTLLVEVARRIDGSVRDRDVAARLGGDEFAVLVHGAQHDAAVRAIADRILLALGDAIIIEGHSVIPQASIGIATQSGTTTAAELMQQADVAMYTAKRNGKGRFDEFDPNMSLTVAHRHQLKAGLQRALQHEEFVLQYQPVIEVSSGTVTAVEALLRWHDPVRGTIGPTEFVGVAEETGLIVPIGRLALQLACRQAAEWTAIAPDLRVFVNLSTRQLSSADLVDDVCAALSGAGLDARHLLLEVTETAMMRDIDEARERLTALRNAGVGVAIDDFGTGFSSLSYLRQLPIDSLKIAKPIIDGMFEADANAAFVKGIVELGHVIGLKVVAEGVEQFEQYAALVGMGCDFVQGYYYAPSMEPEEITELLETRIAVPSTAPAPDVARLRAI